MAERKIECENDNHIYQFRDGAHRCVDCGRVMLFIPENREWKEKK